MIDLSVLIREAACPAYWNAEVERVALSLGYERQEVIQATLVDFGHVLDSLQILAAKYEDSSPKLLAVLKTWYANTNSELRELNVQSQASDSLPSDRIRLILSWRLLGKIESAYEQYELEQIGQHVLDNVVLPNLSKAEARASREIAQHLSQAVAKIRSLQAKAEDSSFEFDLFGNILEAALHHFEEMGKATGETDQKAA